MARVRTKKKKLLHAEEIFPRVYITEFRFSDSSRFPLVSSLRTFLLSARTNFQPALCPATRSRSLKTRFNVKYRTLAVSGGFVFPVAITTTTVYDTHTTKERFWLRFTTPQENNNGTAAHVVSTTLVGSLVSDWGENSPENAKTSLIAHLCIYIYIASAIQCDCSHGSIPIFVKIV